MPCRPYIKMALAMALMLSCSDAGRGTSPVVGTSVETALDLVVDGLSSPTCIASASDGSGALYVCEQAGRIMVLDGKIPSPFLDIRSLVSCCGERGLLSVAFHPQYSTNGFFYVDYTDRDGNTVVARYSRSSSDPMRGDPGSEAVVLRIPQPFSNHNGGQLQFGPDGYLYIGTGDGGSAGDPSNRAQSLSERLGKILRIDVDRATPFAIPEDNPFAGRSDAGAEVWAYGLRNPWRFSFDRVGNLFIGDVGQNQWEEIDLEPVGSGGGRNYGWRLMEGNHCFNPASGCDPNGLVLPIVEYSHADGCSVTGGYRYRGRSVALRGYYVYGDYCSGTVWGARESSSGTWAAEVLLESGARITSFGEDADGELYLADQRGAVYRFVDRGQRRGRPVRR